MTASCLSYVISRDVETRRFKHTSNSLVQLGQTPVHLPAYYLTPEEAASGIHGVDFSGTRMSPGEKGCFLSHVLAWKTLVESGDEWAFVYEDDAIFAADAGPTLAALATSPDSRFDLIRLEATRHRVIMSRTGEPIAGGRKLLTYFDADVCSAGYLIKRSLAKQLIIAAQRVQVRPVDIWLFYREHMPVPAARYGVVEPAICIQLPQVVRRRDKPPRWQNLEAFDFLQSSMDRPPAKPSPTPIRRKFGNLRRETTNLLLGRRWRRVNLPESGPLRGSPDIGSGTAGHHKR